MPNFLAKLWKMGATTFADRNATAVRHHIGLTVSWTYAYETNYLPSSASIAFGGSTTSEITDILTKWILTDTLKCSFSSQTIGSAPR